MTVALSLQDLSGRVLRIDVYAGWGQDPGRGGREGQEGWCEVGGALVKAELKGFAEGVDVEMTARGSSTLAED